MRISDWSSDVCSSDLTHVVIGKPQPVDLSKVLTASDEPAARMVAEMLEKKPQTISSLSSVTTSAEKILLDLSAHNAKEIRPVLPMRAHSFTSAIPRSEERRGGQECVSTCRSRWAGDH